MAPAEIPLASCPSCRGPVARDAAFRPFCSDRCRLVDLGRWLNEDFVVSRPVREGDLPDEEDEAADGEPGPVDPA